MLLGDVLKGGGAAPSTAPGAEMDMGGSQNLGKVLAAAASKLLEVAYPVFGSNSDEGKRIERALKTLSVVHKDIKAEDISATFQMIQSALGLGGGGPLGGIGGGLAGGPPLGAGAPPVGGAPGAGVPPTPGGVGGGLDLGEVLRR